jgi:hypothetical protein
MPAKYHIETAPEPGSFRRAGKYGSIDAREDCSRCTNCVKPRCTYDTYRKETAHNRDPAAPIQPLYECRACLSCVQGCTKGLLGIVLNPEYLAMGDETWKPDIIATTWKQADTGKIPVSGAGYRGSFHGPGFDSIWTDMSEIVRPTRDGIHGREYISTGVDIGPKPMRLAFSASGSLLTEVGDLIELPIPVVLDFPHWQMGGQGIDAARSRAAQKLGTLAIVPAEYLANAPESELPYLAALLDPGEPRLGDLKLRKVRLAEIPDGPGALPLAQQMMALEPPPVVALRLPLARSSTARLMESVRAGVKVFHLSADAHGREIGGQRPKHMRDGLREIHRYLVAQGIRDEITLIVSGGIALAEHMAKAMICGADLVAVDTALLVALGCRVCRGATSHSESCPAEPGPGNQDHAAQRIINLMGAWHSQLIEVLGAMGIREVRRLRGEVGRAIFREDIEREAFGELIRRPA